MSHVIGMREDAIEPLQGTTHIGGDARPTPGTWEDQVLIFAGCDEIESRQGATCERIHKRAWRGSTTEMYRVPT
jgi:hypothetical protein